MKFKGGDHLELDATVTSMFPQEDGSLLLGLTLFPRMTPVSLHDRWITRAADAEGPLSEGESVKVSGKVTSVHDSGQGPWVSFRLDGSTVITTLDAGRLQKPK